MSEELYTVEFAAAQLKLHPKTVLRFIREGRLRATRIGKSFRIRRADLDTLAGIPPRTELPARSATVTAIVDLHGVDEALAQKWARQVPSALKARARGSPPMRAEVIHDPSLAQLKIVVVGPPSETVRFLQLVEVWVDQLTA